MVALLLSHQKKSVEEMMKMLLLKRVLLVQQRKEDVKKRKNQLAKTKEWVSKEDKKWLRNKMMIRKRMREINKMGNIFHYKFQNHLVHRNNPVLNLQLKECELWKLKLQLRIKKILKQLIRKYMAKSSRNKLLTMK